MELPEEMKEDMPDGHGKRNMYACQECGKGFVTEDVDEGTTPFTTTCVDPACNGSAMSFCYKIPQDFLEHFNPAAEWYKPTFAERQKLSRAADQHVAKGGLLLRPTKRQSNIIMPNGKIHV